MLFPGSAELPALSDDRDQSYALNTLAGSHYFSGEPSAAAPLVRRAAEFEREHNSDLSVVLSNLGNLLREIGSLRDADGVLQRALFIAREMNNEEQEAISLLGVGRLFASIGKYAMSGIALTRSRSIFRMKDERQLEGLAAGNLAERSLLTGDLNTADAWSGRAWELADDQKFERDFIRAGLMQGCVALGKGCFVRADERLHHTLARARAVNMVELELPTLIAIAELERLRGNLREARARLDDVWEPIDRGPYPMQKSDAYNVLADIAQVQEDAPAAIGAAVKAYTAAWCDGPPYAYHRGLERAQVHLIALGAPEPELPPFDESKFEALPYVEINLKDEYWIDPDKLD